MDPDVIELRQRAEANTRQLEELELAYKELKVQTAQARKKHEANLLRAAIAEHGLVGQPAEDLSLVIENSVAWADSDDESLVSEEGLTLCEIVEAALQERPHLNPRANQDQVAGAEPIVPESFDIGELHKPLKPERETAWRQEIVRSIRAYEAAQTCR